jgi:hypothetical protein
MSTDLHQTPSQQSLQNAFASIRGSLGKLAESDSVGVASKDSRNRMVIFACFSGIPPARETFRSSELVVGSGPTQPSFLCSAQRCLADGYSRQAKLESSSFLSQSGCISVHHG